MGLLAGRGDGLSYPRHRLKLRVPGGKLRCHNLVVRLQLRHPGTQPRHLLRWRDTLRSGHDATMIRMFSP